MATLWIRDIVKQIGIGDSDPKDTEGVVVSPRSKKLDYDPGKKVYDAAASIDLRLGSYFIVFDRANLAALIPGSGSKSLCG